MRGAVRPVPGPEELDAEVVLELAHPVRECRLGQIEVRGGAMEAAALGDGEKGFDAEEVDTHGPPDGRGGRRKSMQESLDIR